MSHGPARETSSSKVRNILTATRRFFRRVFDFPSGWSSGTPRIPVKPKRPPLRLGILEDRNAPGDVLVSAVVTQGLTQIGFEQGIFFDADSNRSPSGSIAPNLESPYLVSLSPSESPIVAAPDSREGEGAGASERAGSTGLPAAPNLGGSMPPLDPSAWSDDLLTGSEGSSPNGDGGFSVAADSAAVLGGSTDPGLAGGVPDQLVGASVPPVQAASADPGGTSIDPLNGSSATPVAGDSGGPFVASVQPRAIDESSRGSSSAGSENGEQGAVLAQGLVGGGEPGEPTPPPHVPGDLPTPPGTPGGGTPTPNPTPTPTPPWPGTPVEYLDDEFEDVWTSLGNSVWVDGDADGVQDPDEMNVPVPSTEVRAYNATTGELLDSTVTHSPDGGYQLLAYQQLDYAGGVLIQFVAPEGYRFTTQSSLGTPGVWWENDSNPDGSGFTIWNPRRSKFVISEGIRYWYDDTIDAGLVKLSTPSEDESDGGTAFTGTIGDRIWYDANRNGLEDQDEGGIAAVKVNLFDSTNRLLGSTVTREDGNYLFTHWGPGDYRVEALLPAGYQFTSQSTPGVFTLGANEERLDVDWGAAVPAPAGVPSGPRPGRVWADFNGNGLQDFQERGIEAIDVRLLDEFGAVVQTTRTNRYGYYFFAEAPTGTYRVEVDRPEEYSFSVKHLGSQLPVESDIDSDVHETTGRSDPFEVETEGGMPTIDAGLIPPSVGSIGNRVWLDTLVNGIQDPHELGIEGLRVELLNEQNQVVGSTRTRFDGYYTFYDLPEGEYRVRFQNTGHDISVANAGTNDSTDSDADPATGRTVSFTLGLNQHIQKMDAGFVPNGLGTPQGRVWRDRPGEGAGVQEQGEIGFAGVTVRLLDANDLLILQAETDDGGWYSFPRLTPGTYRLEFELPESELPSYYEFSPQRVGDDPDLDSDVDPATGRTDLFMVRPDGYIGMDAGLMLITPPLPSDPPPDEDCGCGCTGPTWATSHISGEVWFDANKNGLHDEFGYSDNTRVRVEVWSRDEFGWIPVPSIDPEILRFGESYSFWIEWCGQEDYSLEYRVVFSVATSTSPTGEPLPPPVFTDPLVGNDRSIDSDASVWSAFDPLTAWSDIFHPGDWIDDIDAGFVEGGTIGNSVWFDANQNGIFDSGEEGFPGVTVKSHLKLAPENRSLYREATTDASGQYSLPKLPTGRYTVEFFLPRGYGLTSSLQGQDPNVDSNPDPSTKSTEVWLDQRLSDATVDAGVVWNRDITVHLWRETLVNGLYDNRREGILGGIRVDLLDDQLHLVASEFTDQEFGWATFDWLPAGSYYVRIVPPSGYKFSVQSPLPEGIDPESGITGLLTIDNEQPFLDVYAGLISTLPNTPMRGPEGEVAAGSGSIANRVWFDQDRDGLQGESEYGLSNIGVYLYDSDDQLLGSTKTEAGGFYQFANLPLGLYKLKFIKPTDYDFTFSDVPTEGENDDERDSDADPDSANEGFTDIVRLDLFKHLIDADAGLRYPLSPSVRPSVTQISWDPLDGLAWEQVGDVSVAHSIDLDQSPGTARSGTPQLVYHSDSAEGRPFFQVRFVAGQLFPFQPETLTATLLIGEEVYGVVSVPTSGTELSDLVTFVIRANRSVPATGRYAYTIKLEAQRAGQEPVVVTTGGAAFVVFNGVPDSSVANPDLNPLGAGWSFSLTDRLYEIPAGATSEFPAGVLRVYGSGGYRFYPKVGGQYRPLDGGDGDTGTLVESEDGWVYTAATGEKWVFDADGLQVEWLSSDGSERLAYTYMDGDADGRVDDINKVTTLDGAESYFVYEDNLLAEFATPNLNRYFIVRMSSGRITTIAVTGWATTTYTYDGSSARLTSVSQGSYSDTYEYDAILGTGKKHTAGLLSGTTLVPAVLGTGLRSVETDLAGRATAVTLDTRGRPLLQVDPTGAVTEWTRDARTGWVYAYTDGNNHVTGYQRDALGFVTRERLPSGLQRTYTYQGDRHRLSGSVDEYGNRTTYSYDSLGRLTVTENPLGELTTQTWYPNGLLQSVREPNGTVTGFQYDSARRLTVTTEAAGTPLARTTTIAYAANGEILSVTEPGNRITSYGYDIGERRNVVIEAFNTLDSQRTTTTYDGGGQIVLTQNPRGIPTKYVYDAARRLVTTTEAFENPLARTTSYQYDGGDRLIRMTDPLSRVTDYGYNPLLRTEWMIEGAGSFQARTTTTVYDAVRNVVKTLTPGPTAAPVVARFEYDTMDRLVRAIEAEGTPAERVEETFYDDANRSVFVRHPNASGTRTSYDRLGRPTLAEEGLDLFGNATLLARNTATEYDRVGHVAAVTVGVSTNPEAANPATTRYEYDALGRLRYTYEGWVAPGAYARVEYRDYDVADNLRLVESGYASVHERVRVTTFAYDRLDRMTGNSEIIDAQNVRRSVFEYDANGNLLSELVGRIDGPVPEAGVVTSYAYDALDRRVLVVEGFGGDPNLYRSTATVYDAADNVRSVTDPRWVTTTFVYDRFDRLISRIEALGVNGKQRTSLFEYDAADNLIAATEPQGYDLGPTGFPAGPTRVTATHAYDALGRRTATTEAAYTDWARRSEFAYDVDDNLVRAVSGLAVGAATATRRNTTTYAYDDFDRLVGTTEGVDSAAVRRESVYRYDARDQMVEERTGLAANSAYARPATTRHVYDVLGRQIELYEAFDTAEQRRATFVYDSQDNLIDTTSGIAPSAMQAQQRLSRTTFAYDDVGRQVGVTEAANEAASRRESQFAYDGRDNLVRSVTGLAATNPHRQETSFEYDELNRRTAVVEGVGTGEARRSEMAYDLNDNLRTLTTGIAPGSPLERRVTTVFEYDELNRRTAVVEAFGLPESRRTEIAYDAADNVRFQTGGIAVGPGAPAGYQKLTATELVYSPLNQVRYQIDGNTSTEWKRTDFTYDAAGNVVWVKETGSAPPPGAFQGDTSRQTQFVYDALNRRTEVREGVLGAGETSNFALNHASPVTTTVYDAQDNVVRTIDPRGVGTSFSYDALGQQRRVVRGATIPSGMASASDFIKPVTEVDYDSAGNPVVIREGTTDGSGAFVNLRETRAGYDALGRRVGLVEAFGSAEQRTSQFVYDAADNLKRETHGIGQAEQNVGAFTYPYQRVEETAYEYDALNRRTETRAAAGVANPLTALGHAAPITTLTYDTQDNLVRVQTPLNTNVYSYDALKRQTAAYLGSNDPSRQRVPIFRYDAADNLVWQWDTQDAKTSFVYDALNRRTVTVLGTDAPAYEQVRTTVTYNLFGAASQQTTLGTTEFFYDRLGRQRWSKTSEFDWVYTGYDATGNRTVVSQWSKPSWKSGSSIVVSPDWRTVTTTYDYDPLNRVFERNDLGLGYREFQYDALGRLSVMWNRVTNLVPAKRRVFEYDQLDRLKKESWYTGADWVDAFGYAYDADGNLLLSYKANQAGTVQASGWRERTFDVLNRVRTARTAFGETLSYSYDAESKVVETIDSFGNRVGTVYDSAGRMSERQYGFGASSPYRVEFEYQADVGGGKLDRIAELRYYQPGTTAGGWLMQLVNGYDEMGRIEERTYNGPGGYVYQNLSYGYDPTKGGLEMTQTRQGATFDYRREKTYQYDARGQVTRLTVSAMDGTPQQVTTFAYDAAGNTPYPTQQEAMDATSGFRVPEANGYKLLYDAEGNVTQMTAKTADSDSKYARQKLTFDHANRLVKVEQGRVSSSDLGNTNLDADVQVEYTYDAEGNLIERKETWLKEKTVPNEFGNNVLHSANSVSTERYVYDGNHVWADLTGTNGLVSHYVYGQGIDSLLARVSFDGQATPQVQNGFWYLTDRQGSVMNIMRASDGTRMKSILYGSTSADARYGTLRDRFEYTGREQDFTTGLQNTRARWLSGSLGRFVSEDSFPDTVTGDLNPYRYVNNSFPNGTDPSGHFGLFGAAIGAIVGGVVGAVNAVVEGKDLSDIVYDSVQGAAIGGLAGFTGGLAAAGTSSLIAGGAALAGLGTTAAGATAVAATGIVVGGAAAGYVGSVTSQAGAWLWDRHVVGRDQEKSLLGSIDHRQAGLAALGGAAGGVFLLGAARYAGVGLADLNRCFTQAASGTRMQVLHGVSGAVGGAIGDGIDQAYLIASGQQDGFDWRRFGTSVAVGAGSAVGSYRYSRVCFTAGTHLLLTTTASKPIEQFKSYEEYGDACDTILTRSEFDSAAQLELRRVLRTFVRVSPVLNFHVNGRIIETTREHPFFVEGRGWIPAAEVGIGDLVLSHTGEKFPVEGVADSGKVETVYNLEVEEHHTYFVGEANWGWSVWAHNASYRNTEAALENLATRERVTNLLEHVDTQLAADMKVNPRTGKADGFRTRSTVSVSEVRTAEGHREIWVAGAGEESMIPPRILRILESKDVNPEGLTVRHVADPMLDTPFPHFNDAEMHIARTAQREEATVRAIGATRDTCQFCQTRLAEDFGVGPDQIVTSPDSKTRGYNNWSGRPLE